MDHKNEEVLSEKLQITYQTVQSDLDRVHGDAQRIDEKTNFLLAFVAGLIAATTIIFPFPEGIGAVKTVSLQVLSVIYFFAVALSAVFIILSMFPKKTLFISPKNYTDVEFHQKQTTAILGAYIRGMKESIESIQKMNNKKIKRQKGAFISISVAFGIFIALLMITIF